MHQGPLARAPPLAPGDCGCMARVATVCLLVLCATLAAQILLLSPNALAPGRSGSRTYSLSHETQRGDHLQRFLGRGGARQLWESSGVTRTLRQRRTSGRAFVGLRGRMGKELLVASAPEPSEGLAPSPADYGHADSTPVPAASLGAPVPAPEVQASTIPPAVAPAPEPKKEESQPPVEQVAPPKAVVQDAVPPKAEAPKPPPRKKKPPPSAPPPRKSVAGVAPQEAPVAAPKAEEHTEAPAPRAEAKAPTGGNKEAGGNAPLGTDAAGDGRGGQNAGAPASMQPPPRPPWPPFPSSPPPNPPMPPPAAPPAPAPSPSSLSTASESSAVSTGLIVAAVVGGGALLLALTALGFFCYCMAAKRRQDELSPLSAVASDSKMAGEQ